MEFPDLGKRCSEKACRQLGWPGPVCPPCNSPVPVRRGESPDVAVGAHTGGDCRLPPGQETAKVFTSGCRREMLRAACEECRGSLCLQHRRPLDHGCARRAHPGSSASFPRCQPPALPVGLGLPWSSRLLMAAQPGEPPRERGPSAPPEAGSPAASCDHLSCVCLNQAEGPLIPVRVASVLEVQSKVMAWLILPRRACSRA
ncbi:AN1-type zinc finger protein 2A isoform X3 [Ovis canadensis]